MIGSEYKNILFDFLTQSRFKVWRHLVFVSALIPIALSQAFFVLGSAEGITVRTIYLYGLGVAAAMVVFSYFNIFFLTPRLLIKGRYVDYVLLFFLSVYGFVTKKYFVESHIKGVERAVTGIALLDWLSNSTLYGICIASSSVTLLFREWIKDSRQIDSLENSQLKNDIEEFKNRINPQLLYSTLSSASVKAKSNPQQTSEILFKLSELLRYQLYDCARERVLLESEIKFIENNLTLRQENSLFRFGYSISAEGDTSLFVAPAVFMPLIDIVLNQKPSHLSIAFKVDDRLRLVCTASGTNLRDCNLLKIKQRLQLLNREFELVKTDESITLVLC